MLPQGTHGHKAQASKAAAKAASHHKPLAPAAAAGASAMAQCLSDPPPLRPDGRPQRGGRHSAANATTRSRGTPASGSQQLSGNRLMHVCFCLSCLSEPFNERVIKTQLKHSSTHCILPAVTPAAVHAPLCAANTHVAHVQKHGSYPLSPAQQQAGFDFSTPSPDDRAKAAGPAGVHSSSSSSSNWLPACARQGALAG